MKMSKTAHRWIGLQNVVFYLLLLAALGLLGFLGNTSKFESDWTFGNRNSLSAPTTALLKALGQPLKFVAYVPDKPGLQEQLRTLVGKYQRVKPDIQLEFVNPDLDPVRAKQDGIGYAGQIALHLGARSEVVRSTQEAVIANALQRMSRGGERLVVFLEGHGERKPLDTESTGMSKLVESLQRNGFSIQPYNLVRAPSIPQNARFVVIASPQQDLLPGEVEVLKKYVEQGGNLLWLQDPGGLHGLQALEDLLGVQIYDGTLVDADERLHKLLGINHPAVIPVVDYGKSDITRNLQTQTLFPFATMVARDPLAAQKSGAIGWKADEFLTTLPTTWLETSGSLDGAVKFDAGTGDQLGPLPLGVSLRCTQGKGQEQRVAVVGDSDCMLNSFVGFGANLELATNLFNWLSADDNLLGIKAVRAPDTQLVMGDALGFLLVSFFLFVLPVGLLAAGTFIWWKRRRR